MGEFILAVGAITIAILMILGIVSIVKQFVKDE